MITDDGRTVSGLKAPPWSAAFVRSRWAPHSYLIYHNSLYLDFGHLNVFGI